MRRRFSVFYIFLALTFFMSALFIGVKNRAFANESVDKQTFINIESKSAMLMDANTNKVIFSVNENEKRPIASMCKIMTLLLCFESMDRGEFCEDDYVVVSDRASSMGGSQVFLEANAKYQARELLKSIVVASANDSCVAFAEKIAGSEEAFVEAMNKRAKELGMNDTSFVNCTGLPKAGQYSTAKDVAIMFSQLISHKKYFNYSSIWMDKIEHPEGRFTEISNTNKLIRFYDGCDSGKTGYTAEAGHCLAASANRNGMRLISVVIASPNSKTRFNEVSSMFNYGFANYVNKLIIDDKMPLEEDFSVIKGEKNYVQVIPLNPVYMFSKKSETHSIEIVVNPKGSIVAPIIKGEILGEICVYEKGVLVGKTDIIANENVAKKSYFGAVEDVIENWGL